MRPLFRGQPNDPFSEVQGGSQRSPNDWAIGDKIRERLALGRNSPAASRRTWIYNVSKPAAIGVDADGRIQLIGPFNLYSAQSYRPGPQTVATRDTSLTIALENNQLSVRDTGGRAAVFDIAKMGIASEAVAGQQPKPGNSPPLTMARTSGELPAELLVTSSNGTFDDADIAHVNHLSFWLLLRP